MDHEAFEAHVKRLEEEAARRPGAYRARVALLAALGYAYIVTVLAGVLILIAGIGFVGFKTRAAGALAKIEFFLLTLAAFLVRALWVRIPPPDGIPLDARRVPRLFAAVERLRKRAGFPRLHRVLLTDDFNAAVAQIPRLGALGWHRNCLILGLPLLHALSPEQFLAVLAHEFGHLSGGHGRIGGWIYRVRQSWDRIDAALEAQRSFWAFVFRQFFCWYAPYFSAYSFVLARAQEREADRHSTEVAGARNAADALLQLAVSEAAMERDFWPRVRRRVDDTPEPEAPFARLPDFFRSSVDPEKATLSLNQALSRETTTDDTHPCLRERLRALGQTERVPEPPAESAAERFLGDALAALSAEIDARWKARVEAAWRERHAYVLKGRERLRALETKVASGPLDVPEVWERACWTEELQGAATALPLYQAVLEAAPDHAGASFAVGRIALGEGREEGIAHIERAMKGSIEFLIPGCEEIFAFLWEQGRREEAAAWHRRGTEWRETFQRAEAERAVMERDAVCLPHGLGAAEIRALQDQFAAFPEIRRACLVRKKVKIFPDQPLFVLGVLRSIPWYRYHSRAKDQALLDRLASGLHCPGRTLIVLLATVDNTKLLRRMKKLPGSEIYRKRRRIFGR